MTVRRMMMTHMQKRRVMVCQVPLKLSHDLAYSRGPGQLREGQEPFGPSSILVTPFMVGEWMLAFGWRRGVWSG